MLEAHGRLSGGPSTLTEDNDEDPVWARLRAGKCRMVLQMHDELVFEVDEADAADAVRAIRPMMRARGRGVRPSRADARARRVGRTEDPSREVY